jgi:hypothetical protein
MHIATHRLPVINTHLIKMTLNREEATTAEIRVHLMKLLAMRNAAVLSPVLWLKIRDECGLSGHYKDDPEPSGVYLYAVSTLRLRLSLDRVSCETQLTRKMRKNEVYRPEA